MWLANTLRIALFTREAIPTATNIWRAILPGEPESEEVRGREGTKIQRGSVGNASLQISITPLRIDFFAAPKQVDVIIDTPGFVPAPTFAIGDFVEEFESFKATVQPWIAERALHVHRVALLASALQQTESVEESYAVLARNLRSVQVAPGEMRDLLYRVNWRRPSAVAGVEFINRISMWQAIGIGMHVMLPDGVPRQPNPQTQFAQLELDLNTPSERVDPFPQEALVPILEELSGLMYENLDHGECR